MIRPALLKSIYDTLGAHPYLALEDFSVVEYQNKDSQPCLSIKYRYNQNWFFNFHIPSNESKINKDDYQTNFWFNCTFCPGRESANESANAKERDGVLSQISGWMKRLYEDIVAAPVVRQFEEHSTALEELRKKFSQLPDEPLSKEDIAEFQEGLERIRNEFLEQLKSATADKEELKRKVEELSRDIDFLKHSLQTMSGRHWGELFLVRFRKWQKTISIKHLTTGVKVFQKLLPQHVSPELDAVVNAVDKVADVFDEIK